MADTDKPVRPNILFIMSDDHAAHAISAYGSRINATANIDRLAQQGMRLNHCYCTNSICTPSRATILTGQYGHHNGVRTLDDSLDGRLPHLVQKQLQAGGYQTATIGKWHLGHGGHADPTGFDYWNVLPGQGDYHDPAFIEIGSGGERKTHPGYVTDLITDMSLGWLEQRDRDRPFFLMCHHKAPHRPWEPARKYADLYEDEDIPEAATLWDDYANRAKAAAAARMRVDRDMTRTDLKQDPPAGLSPEAHKRWCYQRYIKDYLRCVASIDESVGRLLDYLDEQGLAEDTLVVYTSDQGFFLGDHGWYDKRFMYEESLKMPLLVRYPREIAAGTISDAMVTNNDFPKTFLDYAGLAAPEAMQGASAREVLRGRTPADWQTSIYHRYWMHGAHHHVAAHYGVRTHRYKLIYYYSDPLDASGAIASPALEPEWELFDLEHDPLELKNVYHDPRYADVVEDLTAELDRWQVNVQDTPQHPASTPSGPAA
ncbi:MAG: sulfatase [Phycisphaeraceae bacterium]